MGGGPWRSRRHPRHPRCPRCPRARALRAGGAHQARALDVSLLRGASRPHPQVHASCTPVRSHDGGHQTHGGGRERPWGGGTGRRPGQGRRTPQAPEGCGRESHGSRSREGTRPRIPLAADPAPGGGGSHRAPDDTAPTGASHDPEVRQGCGDGSRISRPARSSFMAPPGNGSASRSSRRRAGCTTSPGSRRRRASPGA